MSTESGVGRRRPRVDSEQGLMLAVFAIVMLGGVALLFVAG
jgi:hypothetical protein